MRFYPRRTGSGTAGFFGGCGLFSFAERSYLLIREKVKWCGVKPTESGGKNCVARWIMASREYCSNVAEELEMWSGRLHALSEEIERIPSIDKYRMLPQIEQLHILMTELDDRLCDLMNSCPTVDVGGAREVRGVGRVVGKESWSVTSEKFDYEIGG
jgi:hypothetical protein